MPPPVRPPPGRRKWSGCRCHCPAAACPACFVGFRGRIPDPRLALLFQKQLGCARRRGMAAVKPDIDDLLENLPRHPCPPTAVRSALGIDPLEIHAWQNREGHYTSSWPGNSLNASEAAHSAASVSPDVAMSWSCCSRGCWISEPSRFVLVVIVKIRVVTTRPCV